MNISDWPAASCTVRLSLCANGTGEKSDQPPNLVEFIHIRRDVATNTLNNTFDVSDAARLFDKPQPKRVSAESPIFGTAPFELYLRNVRIRLKRLLNSYEQLHLSSVIHSGCVYLYVDTNCFSIPNFLAPPSNQMGQISLP